MAREKSLPDTLTNHELQLIFNRYNSKCCLTGLPEPHLDHVIPLFIGHGGTILENMIPLSPMLNASKGERNIFEWAELVHGTFGFSLEKFYSIISDVAKLNGMSLEEYRQYYYWCFRNPRDVSGEVIKQKEHQMIIYHQNLEEAIQLYLDGLKIGEITSNTSINKTTLYKALEKKKIQTNRRRG